MELQEEGKPYLLLNEYFDQKMSAIEICRNIFDKEPKHNSLRSFYGRKEAEKIVLSELTS